MSQVSAEYSAAVMKLLNEMKNNISSIDENVKANTGISLDIDYNRVNFYFMMASNAADNKSADKNSDATEVSEASKVSSGFSSMSISFSMLSAPLEASDTSVAWKMILTWMKILTRP